MSAAAYLRLRLLEIQLQRQVLSDQRRGQTWERGLLTLITARVDAAYSTLTK